MTETIPVAEKKLRVGQVFSNPTSYGEFRCRILIVGDHLSFYKVLSGPYKGRESCLPNSEFFKMTEVIP